MMLTLRNDGVTNLSSQLLAGATSCVVVDATAIVPDDGFPFRMRIWDWGTYRQPMDDIPPGEIVEVTNAVGNTLTITRGMEGTTDRDHTSGERCACVLTAGYLQEKTSGPASAVAGNFPVLDATGKALSDSNSKPADFTPIAHATAPLTSSGHGFAATARIAGRITAGDGAVEELTAAQVLALIGSAGIYQNAYQAFIVSAHQILGSANIVGLWFPGHATGTTVLDWSGNGRNGSEGADGSTFSPAYLGLCPTLLRGSGACRGFTVADNAAFSFGNGATDSAFSIFTGGTLSTATNSATYLAKYDITTGVTKREYQFWTDGNSKITCNLYDESAGAKIGRMYNAAAVPSTLHTAFASYDGSAAASGINIYLNGVVVDDADSNSGSYTAMEDTAALLGPMSNAASGLQTNGFKGRQLPIILASIVPTATQGLLMDALYRGFGGVQL